MSTARRLLVLACSTAIIVATASSAYAATSGSFNLQTSGAYWSGNYRFNYKVPNRNTYGAYFSGTMHNWGTDAPHKSYAEIRTPHRPWKIIREAQPRKKVSASGYTYEGSEIYTKIAEARVCRDRTVLPKTCAAQRFNR